ncbi:MAG: SpoIIE family protein phosphatase, partial [Clostridia bacterium]|nr:SpoIIE family protein phosphatase [Clostridia bacterium]
MRLTGALPFIFISFGIYLVRFAAGRFGTVRCETYRAGLSVIGKVSDGDPFSDDIRFIKLNSVMNSGRKFRIGVSFVAALTLGTVNMLTGTHVWYDFFGTVLGCALTPMIALAFSALFDPDAHPTLRRAGIGAASFALTLSLSGVTVGGLGIGLIVAAAISLVSGYVLGVADGAMIATLAGLGLEPALIGIFPVTAMCAGAVGAYSAGGAAVVASTLGMSFALFSEGVGAVSTVLPELILASVIFYPLARFGVIPASPRRAPADAVAFSETPGVGGRMMDISSAMARMSKVFAGLSSRLREPSAAEIAYLVAGALDEACASCSKRTVCHARERFDEGEVQRRAAAALTERGRLAAEDFPTGLVKGCPSVDSVTERINLAYRELIERGIKEDKTALLAANYDNISKMIAESVTNARRESEKNEELTSALEKRFDEEGIVCESIGVYGEARPRVYVRGFTVKDLTVGASDLRRLAEEATGRLLTDPEMSMDLDRLNMYSEARRTLDVKYGVFCEGGGVEANGDVIRSFKCSDGSFCLLICDGMGSGREASLTSHVAAVFLERMIGAGCPEPTALSMLNDFTRERRIECFSTVDLLRIDPFCGEAVFFKSGAASSFVLRDGRLFCIDCETMPLGIVGKASPKSRSFALKEGDRIVMMSDGAMADEAGAARLCEYLVSVRESNDLARTA